MNHPAAERTAYHPAVTSPPPPPPPGQPPPPGPYGSDRPVAPPPPPPSHDVPPSVTWGQTKPPPPPCPIGAWLMIAGGVVMVAGCIIPWFKIEFLDESLTVNAFTDFGARDDSSDAFLIVLAAAVLAFGITTLFAKRLLPIAILCVVVASFGVIASIGRLTDVSDLSDAFGGVTWGAGLPILLVGSAAGLAGGIVALATRRR